MRGLEEAGPSKTKNGEKQWWSFPLWLVVKSGGFIERSFYWKSARYLVICFTPISSLYSVTHHAISIVLISYISSQLRKKDGYVGEIKLGNRDWDWGDLNLLGRNFWCLIRGEEWELGSIELLIKIFCYWY